MIPFKQHDGPLTSELLREPGRFGLGQVPAGAVPDAVTTSICGFCSTGCRLRLHLKNGEAIGLTPEARYPVNLGMACPKGWEALAVLDAPDRATVPLLRDHPNGELRESNWDEAIQTMVNRFKEIQARHGKESLAFISTGQIPCEEMAFLGALAKFGMGMKHGDGNTRQCMATAVVAYKQSFGFDAPPYTYADFEESDVLVFVGGNPAIAHPILWQRVLSNRRSPEIVVIDPRRTETAHSGTRHIALKPKGDLWLLYALAHCIIEEGRVDQAYLDANTNGYQEFKAFLTEYTPEKAEVHTGLTPDAIRTLARLVSDPTKRVSWWWTMGVNQSYEGTRTAQAMINLALMTGNIGKPGTGANSITGQCNAMGSRLFSNTTNLLGGHDFGNPIHRAKISGLLGIEENRIQKEVGWAYDQIIDGIERGDIKGLWVIATNPNHSWINQDRFRKLRDKLDFLVVQDMYSSTETAQICDLLLPAAGWGEKEGVFINSERRIGTIRQVRKPPGVALSDFRIFRLLANAWGGDQFSEWTTPEAVFHLLTQVTEGQPCDISGITGYEMIDAAGGIQWPYPANGADVARERRLFADGRFFTPDGRAKFLYDAPAESLPEATDGKYPFLLLTGRGSSSQWHTQTRTAKSAILRKLSPSELYLDIHPSDAAQYGITEQDMVEVMSRRGSLVARAWLTPTMQRGQVFLPMHDPEVNRLTHASFDPHSRQPSYKASAVAIRKLKKSH
ncbi:nitrate reductase [Luteolibacter sp. LG18]|uniref:molybdopterin oxidoreductase family protein n=1 Tax=Luteolibacter sp. LG18 TaxID=2819286 RepID=UPI0030C6850F